MVSAGEAKTLYKYRELNSRTWSILLGEGVYFANPEEFNDPLECAPIVVIDTDVETLQNIYFFLRSKALRMTANDFKGQAKRYGWAPVQITSGDLAQTINLELQEMYQSLYDEDDGEAYLSWEECLRFSIETLLRKSYVKGVFSMAESERCPLMWSHYGDEHRGVCIGYIIPQDLQEPPRKVSYAGHRNVSTRDIWRAINGNKTCQDRVDKACLYRKAPQWKYEREWRFAGKLGVRSEFLKIHEIGFGLRCAPRSRYAVVKALSGHCDPIDYFEIISDPAGFALDRRKVNTEELVSHFAGHGRTSAEIWGDFFNRSAK